MESREIGTKVQDISSIRQSGIQDKTRRTHELMQQVS